MVEAGPVVVVGNGLHAQVVIDLLLDRDWEVIAAVDADNEQSYRGVLVLDGDHHLPRLFRPGRAAIVAVGSNRLRLRLGSEALAFGYSLATVTGTMSRISPTATLGAGTVAMNGVVINAEARIGDLVIINTSASIDHDCIIGSGAHIGPGSHLAGSVSVGNGAFVGAGTTVIPGIRIGKHAVVGAGSVVIRDVPDETLVYGNPARQK